MSLGLLILNKSTGIAAVAAAFIGESVKRQPKKADGAKTEDVKVSLENKRETGIYTMETRVRYSACGADRRARLSDILDYLQDTCTFQAEELGVGLEYMHAHKTAWVLNSWQADIIRDPVFGEKIRISTWPYEFHGFLGHRNFKIEDEAGTAIVLASSVWVFMDMQKNRPVRIPPEIAAAYQLQPRLEMEYMDRKIKDIQAACMQKRETSRIPRYFIDTNQHVNNAKYILLAEELLPPEFHPVRIRAEYKKPAVYGDMIYPFVCQQPHCQTVKLNGADEKTYAVVEFYTNTTV